MNTIPNDLRSAYLTGKLIPLIGAGVSMSLQRENGERLFPSWGGLLELAADRIAAEQKCEISDGIRAMLKLGRYQTAAELAREGLTGRLWANFFRDVFSVRSDAILRESKYLQEAIWKLSDRVITLNYDKTLRFAASDSTDVAELDNSSCIRLADFCSANLDSKTIWHLHGRVDAPEHIIFTQESYESLYSAGSKYEAAIEILRSVFRENTVLFVGCSLDDAELLNEMRTTHSLFLEHTGPHYALVKSDQYQLIREKIKDANIQLIPFENFGAPLIDVINDISKADKPQFQLDPAIIEIPKTPANSGDTSVRIAVLLAQPINKNYEYTPYIKELKSLKCETNFYHLSLSSLQELGQYDFVFILTKLSRDKLVVEDEWLGTRRITLKEIEDNIGNHPSQAVFYFLDHSTSSELQKDDVASMTLPSLIFPQLSKEDLESFHFKVFKKSSFEFRPEITKCNFEGIALSELKGIRQERKSRTRLPENIDLKTIQTFVGRATDLENICRRIIELKQTNEILTIKGSGGIGKTQTVKRAVIALAERNHFSEGIAFIDCEFIKDLQVFERNIAQVFNLEEAADIREHLVANESKQDVLIILDNFETLLYLNDSHSIKEFLNFVCDYATFIVTSRELLNLDCESVYELRQLTTDEACDLFFRELGNYKVSLDDLRFVRSEIVEKLLDNNPLAIKLIAKTIPKGKSFVDLRNELEKDIFRSIDDFDIDALDAHSDVNIERKRSLFASISYSYNRLLPKEKTVFEVLSLFPAGINLENLKRISSASGRRLEKTGVTSAAPLITDSVIRSLEDKSMIQVDNSMVTLQSIIGKFANQKFQSRPAAEVKRYHYNAFEYCYYFSEHINRLQRTDHYNSRRMANSQQANFIKSIEYTSGTELGSADFLFYLETLNALLTSICTGGVLLNALQRRNDDAIFPDENARLCFEILQLCLEYYEGNFESAYSKLKKIFPLNMLLTLDPADTVQRIIARRAEDIYGMEGERLHVAISEARMGSFSGFYPHSLLHLGIFDAQLLDVAGVDFFTLEAMCAMEVLSVDFIKQYIHDIYEKGHLEMMQAYYVLAKLQPLSRRVINKLIVVNPYTAGLKYLMLALNEKSNEKKIGYFESAASELYHIKYYYVEALFFYTQFLHEIVSEEFEKIRSNALCLAKKHNYRYLLHRLLDLTATTKTPYSAKNYPLENEDELLRHARSFVRKLDSKGRPQKRVRQVSVR